MIIEETAIPNVIPETIDLSKKVLAENIIQNVYPLFSEVYESKVESVENLKRDLEQKRDIVLAQKNELQEIMDDYKRKKKVTKLLDRIEKLVTSGLIYDGALKHETRILLKVINKLSNEKLDFHLRKTLQIISKRFAR